MLCEESLADDSGQSEDKFNAAEHRKDKQIEKVISLQPLRCKVADFRSLNRYAVVLVAASKFDLQFGVLLSFLDGFDRERLGRTQLRIRQGAASRYNLPVVLVPQDDLK